MKKLHQDTFSISSTIAILAILLFAGSCNSLFGGKDGNEQLIIPGESVNGVRIGDSESRVEDKFGTPDENRQKESLIDPGVIYDYEEGISVLFYFESDGTTPGPVQGLAVYGDYEGETPEGIGIGSSMEDVVKAYGSTSDIIFVGHSSITISIYQFETGPEVLFYVENDTIFTIGISDPKNVSLFF